MILDGLLVEAAKEPGNGEIRQEVVNAYRGLGEVWAALDRRKALENYRLALAGYLDLMRSDPASMENVRNVVEARDGIAALWLRGGDHAGAAQMHRLNLELVRRVKYPGDLEAREQKLLDEAR